MTLALVVILNAVGYAYRAWCGDNFDPFAIPQLKENLNA